MSVSVSVQKLPAEGIIFLRDNAIANMMGYAKNHTADEVSTAARHPHNNIGRITSSTIKDLTSMWTKSKAENGGVFYKISFKEGQLNSTFCDNCGIANTQYGGELSVPKLTEHANTISGYGLDLLGYWHSHTNDPENPDVATQPSGGNTDKAIGNAIKQFENGGVGIIINQNSITIYPLNDVKGYTNTDVDQNTTELKLFDQPYKHSYKTSNRKATNSGTVRYPIYDVNVSPVKRSKK